MKYFLLVMFLVGAPLTYGGEISCVEKNCSGISDPVAKLSCAVERCPLKNPPPSYEEDSTCDNECLKKKALERFEEWQRQEREREMQEYCRLNPDQNFCRH